MDKVFIDTSGWVALFIKNDFNHKKATSTFNEMKKTNTRIYTSDFIIDETITTILARSNHHQSTMAGKVLFTSKIIQIVNVSPDHLQDTWAMYQKYNDKKFSFTDVSSLTIMKSLNITKALAFDQELIQAGIELL